MQGKNIKRHLTNKIQDWAESIVDNESVKQAILKDTLVTGGAIVSLLQDEDPHDYDIYFRNMESLMRVANYYIEKFKNTEDYAHCEISIQKCYWDDKTSSWVVVKDSDNVFDKEIRIRVFVKSIGAVESYDQNEPKAKHTKEKPKYIPKFITNNAISLSDKIQIVLRFYGEPSQIHANYDYVHCTSYFLMRENILVMPSRALEAIINKELFYVGSKYPVCSLVRMRKFLSRGWTINAGQIAKIALQISALDLTNLHVFEEQLVGVDSAYFSQFIRELREQRGKNPNLIIDMSYLINLLDKVFDG